MTRGLLTLLSCLLLLLAPMGVARDSIEISPYGYVVSDLLAAFHAESVPCEGAVTEAAELCFEARAASASYLAERLTEIVAEYGAVGLASGGWRSGNGVWTVSLMLPNKNLGQLEVYLAEMPDNRVNGVMRLVPTR